MLLIYFSRPCGRKTKISLGFCGRFSSAELLSFSISLLVVFIWIMTGHWLLMDAMGMGLCVAFIAFVMLPSLKVSTLLLSGLLLYDVFWVFGTEAMVAVASGLLEAKVKLLHKSVLTKDAMFSLDVEIGIISVFRPLESSPVKIMIFIT